MNDRFGLPDSEDFIDRQLDLLFNNMDYADNVSYGMDSYTIYMPHVNNNPTSTLNKIKWDITYFIYRNYKYSEAILAVLIDTYEDFRQYLELNKDNDLCQLIIFM